ncbi:MAG: KH domain-containing protein [Bradymonadales bacterium]|nr:KH domain-containing protein [Bradymonadales bacterium]
MIAEVVEFLARAVVSRPDEVIVREEQKAGRVSVDVTVAKEDFGRVIGRNGQTIDAIRTISRVVARRNHVDATVEVVDPDAGFGRG